MPPFTLRYGGKDRALSGCSSAIVRFPSSPRTRLQRCDVNAALKRRALQRAVHWG